MRLVMKGIPVPNNSTIPGSSSTEGTTAAAQSGEQSGSDGGDEGVEVAFTAVTSQADLDRIVSTRLDRQRRQLEQKYGDYDEVAQKAKAYEELQAAGQTEAEKAEARAKKLEQQLEEERKARRDAEIGAARTAFASKNGIPEVLLSGEDEEHWKRQHEAYKAATAAAAPPRGRAPASGTGDPNHAPNRGAGRERAAEFLKTHKI